MTSVFIRLDKIGDLIATLPVDQLITQSAKVKWVIAEGLGFIAQSASPKREFIELSLKKSDWKKSYQKLLQFLQETKPDSVVIFYAPWWVSLACWKAGVPLRSGRLSQWHSYLFLNKGLRQSRSEAKMHEADYNRELVEHAFALPKQPTPLLKLNAPISPHLLEKLDLQVGTFRVVHPGMFGSALNWSQAKYNELIEQLITSSIVVITGTKNDERFLTEIKAKWKNHPRVRIAQDQLQMNELLSLLTMSQSVIAPSTGVLHLAAALGVPCIGVYSPIQVHHPIRWGPRGQRSRFLLPENLKDTSCPAQTQCLQEKCQFFNCMESTSITTVLEQLEKLEHAKQ